MVTKSDARVQRLIVARTAPMPVMSHAVSVARSTFPTARILIITQEGTEQEVQNKLEPDEIVAIPKGFFKLRRLRFNTWRKLHSWKAAKFVLVDSGTSGGTFFSWIWLAHLTGTYRIFTYQYSSRQMRRLTVGTRFISFFRNTVRWIGAGTGLIVLALSALPLTILLRVFRGFQKRHKPPLRVLYVSHDSSLTGAPVALLHSVAALNRSVIEPIVCAPVEGPLTAKSRQKNIRVVVHRTSWLLRQQFSRQTLLNDLLHLLRGLPSHITLLLREKIDIVHTNSVVTPDAMVAAALCGIKRIWHCREDIPSGSFWRRFQLLMLNSFSTEMIATSNFCRSVLAQKSGLSRTKIIPEALDLSQFDPDIAHRDLRPGLDIDANAFLITLVGVVAPHKGHHILLQALSSIVKQVPQAALLFVGEVRRELSFYRDQLESLIAQEGLKGKVIFCGSRDDIPAVLKATDLVCVPSLCNEGFGRMAIEAGAMGLPVIGSDTGGLKEAVVHEKTGLLVPPGDPGALAEAVVKIASSPGLGRLLGSAGRKRAEQLFDSGKVARQLEDLYTTMTR